MNAHECPRNPAESRISPRVQSRMRKKHITTTKVNHMAEGHRAGAAERKRGFRPANANAFQVRSMHAGKAQSKKPKMTGRTPSWETQLRWNGRLSTQPAKLPATRLSSELRAIEMDRMNKIEAGRTPGAGFRSAQKPDVRQGWQGQRQHTGFAGKRGRAQGCGRVSIPSIQRPACAAWRRSTTST